MNEAFAEFITVISPYTMFMSKEDRLIVLYIQNNTKLSILELKFLLELVSNNLSLFITMVTAGDPCDVDPITAMVETREGAIDCIVLLREKELKGVKLKNGEEPDIRNWTYPIDYIITNYKDRVKLDKRELDVDIDIHKVYEGKRDDAIREIEKIFIAKQLKVSREQ